MEVSSNTFAFATRKTCGTIPTSVPNKSSEISWGNSNCRVLEKHKFDDNNMFCYSLYHINVVYLNSAPPHVPDSIIKPLAHLNINSARLIHHGTVISSDISCRNNAGIVSIVISWRQAVFNIFLKPRMTG